MFIIITVLFELSQNFNYTIFELFEFLCVQLKLTEHSVSSTTVLKAL